MIAIWLRGLARRRAGRMAATAAGIALSVALIASLGAFLATSQETMTARAVQSVATSWQVEVQRGADPAAVLALLRQTPGSEAVKTVRFAPVARYSATTSGSTQTTGAGVLVGLDPAYATAFPRTLRWLVGARDGVMVAQQTSSNLHTAPGDTVTVTLDGGQTADLPVAGVVDVPQANSFFQRVGASAQAQPAAPPDNVVFVPMETFDRLTAALPRSTVTTQFHVARTAPPVGDPAGAYALEAGQVRNLEAAAAGTALVGDNLGAALSAARGDAAYASLLFSFLGAPAVLLATLLTSTLVAAGAERRRQEQSLLRTRGFSVAAVTRLAAAEAITVGTVGSAAGLVLAAVSSRLAFGELPATAAAYWWYAAAALYGLGSATLTVLVPAVRDLRGTTVVDAVRTGRDNPRPWWSRFGVDILLILGALAVFWAASGNDYSLVLAPEGVPQISVSYWALFGPALLWVGGTLLWRRLVLLALRHGRRPVTALLRPMAGRLSGHGAASLVRQRSGLAKAAVLLTLALAFAASTATFNATYAQQAEADAQLTNGADVTVTQPPTATSGPGLAAQLATVPGVRAVEPVQHRYAYIGADLQDLYGVRPSTIAGVTALKDAYFVGGTARQLMATLASAPDSILVSSETAKDFQLSPGDPVNLRLQDAATKGLKTVPFHFAGVVTEFPTAPKDSFFVANAAYVAQATGTDAVGTFLVDTGGSNQREVADALRGIVGTSATVTDIGATRSTVGSSLTSVNLQGLTRLELGYAVLLAVAAAALMLGVGLTERRRSQAVMAVLGARPGHLRGLALGEATLVLLCGGVGGALLGWLLAEMLVKILTGVFDPPPDAIAVPWTYLAGVAVAVVGSIVMAGLLSARARSRPPVEELRGV